MSPAKSPFRYLLALPATLALTACSNIIVTDPTSPLYVPSVGSKVTVLQRLDVPPGTRRVFLQDGKVIRKKDLDEYRVNCNFDIKTLDKTTRHVEPGSYSVTRVQRSNQSIVQTRPVMLASLSMTVGFGGGGGDGPPMMFEQVRMHLQSEPPSDIRWLDCRGAIADPVNMELPGLAQIRATLGEYAHIDVPEQRSP